MLENLELEIVKTIGSNSVLVFVIYLLWKQYTGSVQRMFEREKEFYMQLLNEVRDLKSEIHELNAGINNILKK